MSDNAVFDYMLEHEGPMTVERFSELNWLGEKTLPILRAKIGATFRIFRKNYAYCWAKSRVAEFRLLNSGVRVISMARISFGTDNTLTKTDRPKIDRMFRRTSLRRV